MQKGFFARARGALYPEHEYAEDVLAIIARNAHPLKSSEDLDPIIQAVGDSQVVMIGEATHGTHEFYDLRAQITKRLIAEKGFNFVAVEADWPDAYRINRYVQQMSKDTTARECLSDFKRFPLWMWRNPVVLEFIEWLRNYNANRSPDSPAVGFYGLDLYSLFTSADHVIAYLEKVSPADAKLARKRYATLNRFRSDPFEYAQAVELGLVKSAEDEVVQQLVDMLKNGPKYLKQSVGFVNPADELFFNTENAHLVKNAEEYYRKTFAGGYVTWNLRDKHMCATLEHLISYYQSKDNLPKPKAILWAHNSHLGDARATEVAPHELNLGQLVREKFGLDRSFNIGFSTYDGTVTAARRWGGQAETMDLNPGLPGSYEELFHKVTEEKMGQERNWYVILRSNDEKVGVDRQLVQVLREERLQRAVGVQYVKRTERMSHYRRACVPLQFDVLIHIDRTRALGTLD